MLEFHLKRQRNESRMLRIGCSLPETHIDYGFVKLDGSTKQEDRELTHSVTTAQYRLFILTQACP
jgi:hypothetical protein